MPATVRDAVADRARASGRPIGRVAGELLAAALEWPGPDDLAQRLAAVEQAVFRPFTDGAGRLTAAGLVAAGVDRATIAAQLGVGADQVWMALRGR